VSYPTAKRLSLVERLRTIKNSDAIRAATLIEELAAALEPFVRFVPVGGGDGGTFTLPTPTADELNAARAALAKLKGETNAD